MALAQILGLRDQIVDNQGNPLAGGLVNIYEPNTTNRVTSYDGADIVNANPNPVVLSGAGRANIWVTRDVDVRITDKDGNLVTEELSVNPDDLGGSFDSGLVPNGSFETDADANDVPDGWLEENIGGSSNNGLDTGESTDGGQSWRFQGGGAAAGELVTEDFFPVNDADDLRVQFDLRSTVAGVRNIVRVEWYDISQVSISNTDVYDSTANPLTFTSQVLTATPPTGARFAKLRLFGVTTGGTLTGITYFDRFQVFYPQVVSGVFDNLTLSGNDIISTNTNGDINISPNGTGDTVIKNLEALTAPQLGFASEVSVEVAAANRLRIRADINAATPPTTEAVTAALDFYDADGTDLLGELGYAGAATLSLISRMHGAPVSLQGEDASGNLRVLVTADPDGAATIRHAGDNVDRLITTGTGVQVRSDGNTDAEDRLVELGHQDGTLRARIGHVGSGILQVKNAVNGSGVRLTATQAGGAERTLIDADPDGNVDLYDPAGNVIGLRIPGSGTVDVRSTGNSDTGQRRLTFSHQDGTARGQIGYISENVLRIQNVINGGGINIRATNASAASRALVVGDPDTTVDIYDPVNNEINLQTQQRDASDVASGALVRGPDDVLRDIGFNVIPTNSDLDSGNDTVAQADIGAEYSYNTATARTLNLNNVAAIPVNAVWAYYVGPSGGTLTAQAGAGVTLTYWDGLAWQTTAAAGSVTIGEGQGTIKKISDTNYRISGPNIS